MYQIDRHRRRLLWMGQKRTKKSLDDGFSALEQEHQRQQQAAGATAPTSFLGQIVVICSDIWKAYLTRADDPAVVEAVDGDTMGRALALADWLRNEAERVYSVLGESPADRADRELVEWIRDRGAVTPREVAQGPSRYRGTGGRDRAEADLLRLVAAGRVETTDRHGRRAYRVAGPATDATATDTPRTVAVAAPTDGAEEGEL